MTREQVKELLDRILTWPPERQADLAEVAKIMEAQDKSGIGLSEEQATEIGRRLADKEAKSLTLAELNQHLRRRYGV